MKKEDVPYLSKPCNQCPFRKDNKGIKFLGENKANEILKQNKTIGFICHKTASTEIDNNPSEKRRQCAGALILAKKENTFQPFSDLYKKCFKEDIPLFDEHLIVDTSEEFVNQQKLE